jgi:hypothetical protein
LPADDGAEPDPGKPLGLILGDAPEILKTVPDNYIPLAIPDPPYNIGIDYGTGKEADLLSNEGYLSWCKRWLEECHRVLTADGTLWLIVGDEYADYLGVLLRQVGFHRRAWVKWYETFGNCNSAKTNFIRTSRHRPDADGPLRRPHAGRDLTHRTQRVGSGRPALRRRCPSGLHRGAEPGGVASVGCTGCGDDVVLCG